MVENMKDIPETRIELEYPYSERWKYGYINVNNDGRKAVTLYNSDRDRSTTSYARYLMAVKLGRFLKADEQVDHIDEDKTNDSTDNLQILSSRDNFQKYNKRTRGILRVEIKCPNCSTIFIRDRNKTHVIKPSKLTFCSRTCNGKFTSIGEYLDSKEISRIAKRSVIREFREYGQE